MTNKLGKRWIPYSLRGWNGIRARRKARDNPRYSPRDFYEMWPYRFHTLVTVCNNSIEALWDELGRPYADD